MVFGKFSATASGWNADPRAKNSLTANFGIAEPGGLSYIAGV
jgi:hypothetical protein